MMKRTFLPLLLSLLLLLAVPTAVRATEPGAPLIVDNADLLTSSEEAALTGKAYQLKAEYQMDVVILTVTSTDGQTPRRYAESYYDRNGYASDGILLLVSIEERDWYICTTGKAQDIFPNRVIDQLGDTFLSYLSSGAYSEGFNAFLDSLPDYFARQSPAPAAHTIRPLHIVICLVIGMASGGITVLIMRSRMKTDRPQHSASEYLDRGSFHLNIAHDRYLYSHVTKTPKPDNSSGPHGGGHGGGSHGGGGGKF